MMTAVFETDLRKFDGNPHKADTPFGRPVILSIGNLVEEVDRLRDQLHDCETSLNIFDEGRSSEYWMRHVDQPSNE